MPRRLLAAAIAAATLLLATPAIAAGPPPAAIPTRTTTLAPVDNTKVIYDVYGQRIDAHDGDLLQTADGTIYLYGTAYGCGYMLNVESPYCGVRVYETRDLRNYTPAGAFGGLYALDHLDPAIQELCGYPNFGCFRPHVVQRPSDGKYVLWLNSHQDAGYTTFLADSPRGPFTPSGVTPDLAVKPPVGGLRYGDHDVTVDPAGVAWLTYTAIYPQGNLHELNVERLDPTFLTGTGTATNVGTAGSMAEAPSLFRGPTGKWHLAFSDPAKPYISTATGVVEAPTPSGPWGPKRTLAGDSCSGQPASVVPVKSPSTGATVYVYTTDRWVNAQPNQALANNFHGRLTFSATGSVNAYACQTTWTL